MIPINSITAGDQVTPDAVFLNNGERAVVVWRDAATGAIKGRLLGFSPAA